MYRRQRCMYRRQQWGGLLVAVLFSFALMGCPKQNATESAGPTGTHTAAGGGGGGQKLRIAVLPKGTAHSFWQTVKAGADAAGAEEGAEIIWQGPSAETDITEQINIFQNQVNAGVSGIVLAATDAQALVKPVQDAMAKGIPVVTIDSGLSEPISLCYIATDNVEGGRQAAEALAKEVGDKGNVGVLPFKKGARSSDEREKGFMEGIAKHPNIKVVATLYTDSDANKALDQTFNMLTAHPDIVGIFAANEPGGIGAANALRQRKLAGKVKLVAYDASDVEMKGLQEGVIQALIVQNPYRMGYEGVKTVIKAIRRQPIPDKQIDTGVTVVTKDNLNTPDVQKLLKPTK
ncbi:MAG TPA: ABC transporter substrate-binding protein [Chthonomonadaceae bacterium]|nr:ABC transporter substrate-binding protein [Chthonomonadaceae bacterium]